MPQKKQICGYSKFQRATNVSNQTQITMPQEHFVLYTLPIFVLFVIWAKCLGIFGMEEFINMSGRILFSN